MKSLGPCIVSVMIKNIESKYQQSVLGEDLIPCSMDPLTGFYRSGCCDTGPDDQGSHTECVVLTEEFLTFSRTAGNDLSTPMPEWGFPGLKPGDRWCLCAARWQEALQAGVAPSVLLEATNAASLEYVDLDDLRAHSISI